jgi:hypothetical protein
MSLSREQILNAEDIKTELVPCPEWGGDVRIRVLTLTELQQWRRSNLSRVTYRDKDGKPMNDYVADPDKVLTSDVRLICISAIDDAGKPLFTPEDVDRLMKKSAAPLARLAMRTIEISGVRETPADTEGFSGPSPNGSSSSD